MAALGRILQIIGWLWFAAGFLGPLVGFDGVNLFPGLILVFVARAIRTQAARHPPPEPDEDDRGEEPRPERVLNTERIPRTPAPAPTAPDPIVRYQRAEAQTTMDEEDDSDSGERDNLIERIGLAGRETTTTRESAADRSGGSTLGSDRGAGEPRRKPMTSAEMLAQAHERWDRKR